MFVEQRQVDLRLVLGETKRRQLLDHVHSRLFPY
jgi:hypothetical protein